MILVGGCGMLLVVTISHLAWAYGIEYCSQLDGL